MISSCLHPTRGLLFHLSLHALLLKQNVNDTPTANTKSLQRFMPLSVQIVARIRSIQIRAGPLDGIDHWDHIVGNTEVVTDSDYPRQEMLYNLDPYTLWTDDDDDS